MRRLSNHPDTDGVPAHRDRLPALVVLRRTEPEAEFVAEAYEGLGAVIALDAVGAELRLADLYARVDFGAGEPESDDADGGAGATE